MDQQDLQAEWVRRVQAVATQAQPDLLALQVLLGRLEFLEMMALRDRLGQLVTPEDLALLGRLDQLGLRERMELVDRLGLPVPLDRDLLDPQARPGSAQPGQQALVAGLLDRLDRRDPRA